MKVQIANWEMSNGIKVASYIVPHGRDLGVVQASIGNHRHSWEPEITDNDYKNVKVPTAEDYIGAMFTITPALTIGVAEREWLLNPQINTDIGWTGYKSIGFELHMIRQKSDTDYGHGPSGIKIMVLLLDKEPIAYKDINGCLVTLAASDSLTKAVTAARVKLLQLVPSLLVVSQ